MLVSLPSNSRSRALVRLLGRLLGDVIREQHGQRLFDGRLTSMPGSLAICCNAQ